jgi:hypothetical protein
MFNCQTMLEQLLDRDSAREESSMTHASLDEKLFWQRTLSNIQRLAHVAETSGRWPRSRVTGGVIDSVHMAELIESNDFLRDRLHVVDHPDQIAADTPAGKALADVAEGRRKAHGFLIGCAVHWMGLVATNDSASAAGPRVWLFDSLNRTFGRLRTQEELAQLAESCVSEDMSRFKEKLKSTAGWQHRSAEAIEEAAEDGVPEWWKGIKKNSMFWRFKPRCLRQELQYQELDYLQKYLRLVSSSLLQAWKTPSSKTGYVSDQ